MKIRIKFEKHDFKSPVVKAPRNQSKAYDRILSQALVNYPAAKSWQEKRAPLSPILFEAAQNDFLQTGNSYKILVEEDGINEITKTALENAGLNLSRVDPRKIRVFHKGQEIAILIKGEADGVFNDDDFIEFYGAKIKSNYTKTNVYWISVGDTNGKRMLIKDGSITGSQPAGRYRRQCGYYLCKLV